MTLALDYAKIRAARLLARRSTLLSEPSAQKSIRAPDIAVAWFEATERVFAIVFADGSRATMPADKIEDVDGCEVIACDVDSYRRGVVVILGDGSATSFSGDLVKYETDESFRQAVQRAYPSSVGALAERVAARIAALRKRRGWSVAELARRTGIAAPNLHRLEAAKHVPSTSTLLRVAEAFGIGVECLVRR